MLYKLKKRTINLIISTFILKIYIMFLIYKWLFLLKIHKNNATPERAKSENLVDQILAFGQNCTFKFRINHFYPKRKKKYRQKVHSLQKLYFLIYKCPFLHKIHKNNAGPRQAFGQNCSFKSWNDHFYPKQKKSNQLMRI